MTRPALPITPPAMRPGPAAPARTPPPSAVRRKPPAWSRNPPPPAGPLSCPSSIPRSAKPSSSSSLSTEPPHALARHSPVQKTSLRRGISRTGRIDQVSTALLVTLPPLTLTEGCGRVSACRLRSSPRLRGRARLRGCARSTEHAGGAAGGEADDAHPDLRLHLRRREQRQPPGRSRGDARYRVGDVADHLLETPEKSHAVPPYSARRRNYSLSAR